MLHIVCGCSVDLAVNLWYCCCGCHAQCVCSMLQVVSCTSNIVASIFGVDCAFCCNVQRIGPLWASMCVCVSLRMWVCVCVRWCVCVREKPSVDCKQLQPKKEIKRIARMLQVPFAASSLSLFVSFFFCCRLLYCFVLLVPATAFVVHGHNGFLCGQWSLNKRSRFMEFPLFVLQKISGPRKRGEAWEVVD